MWDCGVPCGIGNRQAHDALVDVAAPVLHQQMWLLSESECVYDCFCCAVNVLADHVAAHEMSARHISELRRDLVPDPDIALLAQLSTAAGITLR